MWFRRRRNTPHLRRLDWLEYDQSTHRIIPGFDPIGGSRWASFSAGVDSIPPSFETLQSISSSAASFHPEIPPAHSSVSALTIHSDVFSASLLSFER